MTQRRWILFAGGAAVLLIAGAWFLVLPSILERWVRRESGTATGTAGHWAEERPDGMAPVQLVNEDSLSEKGDRRIANCARFVLSRGQIFVGDDPIPLEDIRAYLDQRVLREEINSAVIFPAKGSSWGDIFPVIDACRKSRVHVVYLNEQEDPRPPL